MSPARWTPPNSLPRAGLLVYADYRVYLAAKGGPPRAAANAKLRVAQSAEVLDAVQRERFGDPEGMIENAFDWTEAAR